MPRSRQTLLQAYGDLFLRWQRLPAPLSLMLASTGVCRLFYQQRDDAGNMQKLLRLLKNPDCFPFPPS